MDPTFLSRQINREDLLLEVLLSRARKPFKEGKLARTRTSIVLPVTFDRGSRAQDTNFLSNATGNEGSKEAVLS